MSLLEKDTLEKDQLNSTFSEISNYIDKGLLKIDTALYLLNTASIIRPKNINFYIDFCKFIKEKYEIENESIQTNIFKLDSIFELVAQDKIDDLKILDFDINQMTSKNLSLIDIACKFGSYKCFQYLKLLGSKITNERFAIEGGNKDIIMSLYNDGYQFNDECELTAIRFHHHDVFDWLLEIKQEFNEVLVSYADEFYNGNILFLIFLVENGYQIDDYSNLVDVLLLLKGLH